VTTPPKAWPLQGRLGWTLVGLILAWNVAQGSLLQFAAISAVERLANAVFLIGAGLSLLGHELAQGAVRAASARNRSRKRDAEPRGLAELAAAAAGPIASFLFSVVIIAAARVGYVAGLTDALIRSLAAVATFNIVLAVANLAPALPMDGGRLLRAVLRAFGREASRAAGAAGAVGEAIALLILAVGFASAFVANLADAFSWILVGVILFAESRAERRYAAEAEVRGSPFEGPALPTAGGRAP
jgi:Zn-dependent protease